MTNQMYSYRGKMVISIIKNTKFFGGLCMSMQAKKEMYFTLVPGITSMMWGLFSVIDEFDENTANCLL